MATLVVTPPQQAHHIDSFDGMGIAVLMVLLAHGTWFKSGWAGWISSCSVRLSDHRHSEEDQVRAVLLAALLHKA